MKNLNLVLLATAMLSFASCSKDEGNSAVDKDGNCTQATIDAFNDVRTKGLRLTYNSSRNALQDVQNSCRSFKNLVAGKSCKALDASSGTERLVDSTSRDSICNEVDRQLLALDRGATVQPGTAGQTRVDVTPSCSSTQNALYSEATKKMSKLTKSSSAEELDSASASCESFKRSMGSSSCNLNGNMFMKADSSYLNLQCSTVDILKYQRRLTEPGNSVVLSQLTGKLKITVLKAPLIKAEASIFAYQEGKAYEYGPDQALNITKSYCVLITTNTEIKNNETQYEISKPEFIEADNYMKLKDELDKNNLTEITCYSGTNQSAKDLTLGDLRLAFKDIFKVELAQ